MSNLKNEILDAFGLSDDSDDDTSEDKKSQPKNSCHKTSIEDLPMAPAQQEFIKPTMNERKQDRVFELKQKPYVNQRNDFRGLSSKNGSSK